MHQIPVSPKKEEFQPGMKVRILEGPFKEFNGIVREVNHSTGRAVVAVNVFGREVVEEFGFSQMASRL